MTDKEIILEIEDMRKFNYTLAPDEVFNRAIQAIQQTTTWTLCSERFPNEEEYRKNNGMFNVTDGNRSYAEWFDVYDKRGFGEPTMCGFRIDRCVIAWQPLPKPYKGE